MRPASNQSTIDKKIIKLPEPNYKLNVPLMQVLRNRQSKRNMSDKKLSYQELSNLLWAACGVSREGGERTAPLLWNFYLYVALESGIYKYDAENHQLNRVVAEDIRNKITYQDFAHIAPAIFMYGLDRSEMTQNWVESTGGKDFFVGTQVGVVAQNAYLYAAANDLNTVAMSWFDKDHVNNKLGLSGSKSIYLVQPIGYPQD